jgi:hypothetical protein
VLPRGVTAVRLGHEVLAATPHITNGAAFRLEAGLTLSWPAGGPDDALQVCCGSTPPVYVRGGTCRLEPAGEGGRCGGSKNSLTFPRDALVRFYFLPPLRLVGAGGEGGCTFYLEEGANGAGEGANGAGEGANGAGEVRYTLLPPATEGRNFALVAQTPDGRQTTTCGVLPPNIRTLVVRRHNGVQEAFPWGPPVCFRAGTRLLTPTGYQAIETLHRGDFLVSYAGGVVAVKDLVHFTALGRDCPLYCLPAGVIRPAVPGRDLFMSGSHAFRAQGVWRHMKCSRQAHRLDLAEPIDYYHIILPDYYGHTLVAEGVEVESCYNRANQGGEHQCWSCTPAGCVPFKCSLVDF